MKFHQLVAVIVGLCMLGLIVFYILRPDGQKQLDNSVLFETGSQKEALSDQNDKTTSSGNVAVVSGDRDKELRATIKRMIADLDGITHPGDRAGKISQLCEYLVGYPEIAMEWLGTLPDHPSSTTAFERFASKFTVQGNVDAAVKLLGQLPKDQRGGAFLTGMCRGISYDDPDKALEILNNWGDQYSEVVRIESLMQIVSASACTKPWQDVAKFLEKAPNDSIRVQGGEELIQGQMLAGKVDVAEWVALQAERKEGGTLFRTLMSNWITKDSIAASKWLAEQAPSKARDSAVKQMVDMIAGDAPEEAFEWAASIQDNKLRSDKLRFVLNRYRLLNPSAAAEMVNSTKGLSEGERNTFLNE